MYVGGAFTIAGSVVANNVARWDGTRWRALGRGLEGDPYGEVDALSILGDGSLIAGGKFDLAGGNPAQHIARWDGERWQEFGSGLNWVFRLAVDSVSGTVYAASAGFANGFSGVSRWTGSEWVHLGERSGDLSAIAVLDGEIYAGGIGWVRTWDGTAWQSLDWTGLDCT